MTAENDLARLFAFLQRAIRAFFDRESFEGHVVFNVCLMRPVKPATRENKIYWSAEETEWATTV